MATTPAYASTPGSEYGQVSAANTARDGSGTTVKVFTAGSSGSKIEEIRYKATVTTTAGMIRIFLSLDAGTTKRLLTELPVAATTVSATVEAAENSETFDNLVLPGSAELYASTHNAEASNIFVLAGDF